MVSAKHYTNQGFTYEQGRELALLFNMYLEYDHVAGVLHYESAAQNQSSDEAYARYFQRRREFEEVNKKKELGDE